MSADNGIYILQTWKPPIKKGNHYTNQPGREYRVSYCNAIDNIEGSDLFLAAYFGDSKVYDSYEEAYTDAVNMTKHFHFLEYGIVLLPCEKYYPNITCDAAWRALDVYEGAEPVSLF